MFLANVSSSSQLLMTTHHIFRLMLIFHQAHCKSELLIILPFVFGTNNSGQVSQTRYALFCNTGHQMALSHFNAFFVFETRSLALS